MKKRVAALAASSALLLSGCEFSIYDMPLPGGADLGDNPYEVTAKFRDVMDLVPQSTVKVDDITVGKITDIEADGYTAKVTMKLREEVELPDNAVAKIRQTSLLGEKFVSLAPPPSNPSSEPLEDGDVIGLEKTGRNVEVEEVLGALSLVLNGGGVGQLKTITQELNKALEGREGSVKSVLQQLRIFMTQLDGRKDDIVTAIERVNSLSVALNKETETLDLALDELPSAIASVDRQRDDLIKMLEALNNLSGVATRVIRESKAGTIKSLNALAPTLTALAKSGDDFANSLQIVLTFPFIDGVVGKNPQQARDLHMGDYTNLDIVLDLDVETILENEQGNLPGGGGGDDGPLDGLPGAGDVTSQLPDPGDVLGGGGGGGNGGGGNGGGGGGGGGLPDLPGGLGRAAVGAQQDRVEKEQELTELAGLLAWGVLHR